MALRHGFLEEYVFEKVIASLEKNPRWGQRRAEPNSLVDARLKSAELKRDELNEKVDRLADAIANGIIAKEQATARSASLQAELKEVQEEIGRLLGSNIMHEAVEGGFDWRVWTPMRRRNSFARW